MAKRDKDERIQALFKSGKHVYSISKCNTIEECLYEAYQSYILHNKGQNGIYGILGTKIHDKLEQIINGEATADELPDTLNEELLDLDMLDIHFPKDFKGGDSIRDNWVADMKHFCSNFTPPNGKFRTEELVIYPLPKSIDEEGKETDRYVQGYIDLIRENTDGSIDIYDWKTSTNFKKDELLHHGRQLIFYALAKRAEGFDVRRVAWIMLKYCEVRFMGYKRANSKKKDEIVKVVNRGKLISELKTHLERDLEELGYDEIDIEIMLKDALAKNSLDVLPEQVRNNYTIKPYVREYELSDELVNETIAYLNAMADRFEGLDPNDESQWKPREFTRINGAGNEAEDTFFCNNLCNYRNSCIHLKRFNDQWELRKRDKDEDADLF